MWKWIFDAHRLLGVTVEIVDDQLVSLTKTAVRLDVESGESASVVPQALAQSVTSATPVVASAAGVRVSSTPIMAGAAAAGAVLMSATPTDRLGERELARAGSLLASA